MPFGRQWTDNRDLRREIRTTGTGITNDELTGDLEDELACSVCYTILLTAMTMACAHRICESCADSLQTQSCPECRAAFGSLGVDEETRQRVGEVPAKCGQCGSFQGSVKDVLKHKEKECLSQTVYCRWRGCGDTMARGLLGPHEDVCDNKKVTCHCGYKTILVELDRHLATECATLPIRCPLDCGTNVERAKVAVHITQECQRKVTCCSVPGCGFVGRVPDLAEHKEGSASRHVKLLELYNTRLKICLAEGKIKRSDAALVYGRVKAIIFTVPQLKRKITEGRTTFTSPSCKNIHDGEWKVSLQKEGYRWYLCLCLVSRASPLHLKVMFLLQSPGPDCGEDHAITLDGTVEAKENWRYGAPVPFGQLEEYSAHDDRLTVKVLLQEVSASVDM
ncbi:TNF receptor-associated factor 3-like [Branchiostoma floridae]|uniref:TNF receptor-associated factor 3-like n=1 Tax=Branchiostoma floridae TaxID=7739 RepID=A0A9J7LWL7_BRAFL|nr:TNF receptor-associated factor 3-like [Branchiostoma floridae]